MSDQTNDDLDVALTDDLGGDAVVENILTLDRIISSAKLVERIARICLRGDLEADLLDTLNQLSTLVDREGNLLEEEDEATLESSSADRVHELGVKAHQLRNAMAAETFVVRFRAMNDDDWDAFEEAHRGPDDKPKNPRDYYNRLIAATAISQPWSVEDVEKIRGKLSPRQMIKMANTAYAACTQGGLDVPKLPDFLLAPKHEEQ